MTGKRLGMPLISTDDYKLEPPQSGRGTVPCLDYGSGARLEFDVGLRH